MLVLDVRRIEAGAEVQGQRMGEGPFVLQEVTRALMLGRGMEDDAGRIVVSCISRGF